MRSHSEVEDWELRTVCALYNSIYDVTNPGKYLPLEIILAVLEVT